MPAPESLGLAGTHTIASLSEQLDGHALFTGEPGMHAVARLPPLGVRERGARSRAAPGRHALGEVVGREPAPLRFVVSTRADLATGSPSHPALEFKVDPIPGEWDAAHMERWRRRAASRLDLKAYYDGTVSTTRRTPTSTRRRRVLPDAVLEDA